LLIKYKPKHPKKGEYKEQNGRTHVQEDKKITKEGETQGGNIKFLNLLQSREAYQIKKGEDLLKGWPSLKEPLLIATTCFKIEIVYARCSIIDTLYL
jgi:hypothetical protein